eukprot:31424-Pelagococcus_subviridis.AAC.6
MSAPHAAANVAIDSVSSSLLTSYRRDDNDTDMDSSRSRVFSSSCSAALCTVSLRRGRNREIRDVVVVVQRVQQHLPNRPRPRVQLHEALLRQPQLLEHDRVDRRPQRLAHVPAPRLAKLQLGVQLARRLLQRRLHHLELERDRRAADAAGGVLQVAVGHQPAHVADRVNVVAAVAPAGASAVGRDLRLAARLQTLQEPLRRRRVRLEQQRVVRADDHAHAEVDDNRLIAHEQRGVRIDPTKVARGELRVAKQRAPRERLAEVLARLERRGRAVDTHHAVLLRRVHRDVVLVLPLFLLAVPAVRVVVLKRAAVEALRRDARPLADPAAHGPVHALDDPPL